MEPETDPNYGYAQYDLAIRELVVVVLVMSIVFVPPILCFFFDRRSRRRHLSPPILPTATALDPSLFEFLPTLTYSSSSAATAHRPPPECAICLTDFQEGDEGRMLPNCNHVFHCHCIDMWFLSHSNCPMCRAPVRPPRISSQKDNTEASVSVGFSNLSLPAPIWCPRKPLEKMELVEVKRTD